MVRRALLGAALALAPIDGVLFFDGGLAWDEEAGQDPYFWRAPLFSWGFGLRMNVFYAVLRLDYSFPLDRERGGLFSIAFGPSF